MRATDKYSLGLSTLILTVSTLHAVTAWAECEDGPRQSDTVPSVSSSLLSNVSDVAKVTGAPAINQKVNFSDYFHVSVTSQVSGSKKTEGNVDVDYSSLGLTIGKVPLQRVLSKYGISKLKAGDVVFNIDIKSSLMPYLMKSHFQSSALGNLASVGADEKTQINQQVTTEVIQGLMADPNFRALPAAIQKQIESQQINAALKTADDQLNQALAQASTTIKKQLDGIDRNAYTQEVAVVLGKVSGDGTGLLFVKAGKDSPQMGPTLDQNGKSALERLLVQNSDVQRTNTPFSTGIAQVSAVKSIRGADVEVDAMVYHDRLPYTGTSTFDSNNLGASAADLSRDSKWAKMDSSNFRASLKGSRGELYASGGKADGEVTYAAGGTLDISKRSTVYADYSSGGFEGHTNSQSQKRPIGESAFYSYKVDPLLTVYGGGQEVRNQLDNSVSKSPDGTVDFHDALVGAKFTLKGKAQDSHLKWNLGVEEVDHKGLHGTLDPSSEGWDTRVSSGITFNWH